MTALRLKDLEVEKIKLNVPPLDELAAAIAEGLKSNYVEVDVRVVDCPDLTLAPYNLAAKGLGGNTSVVQVGDTSYLFPNTLKDKIYDFRDVSEALDMESAFIMGCGASYWSPLGNFGEMYANITINGNEVRNLTKDVYSKDKTITGITVRRADINETRFCTIGNLFVCRGEPGKVIYVSCKGRKAGDGNFPGCINTAVKQSIAYPVALGIVMRMARGKSKHHVPPSFLNLKDIKDLKNWLFYSTVAAPFNSLGTLLTHNPPDWNILTQHIHSFSNNNEGGHYYHDVTPRSAEFEAYLAPAETLCSIDKPKSLFLF